jgi:hypothetical protein
VKTISFNGEFWYEDNTPLLQRLATWCIWIGGRQRWDRLLGRHVWQSRAWQGLGHAVSGLMPIALFGHRVSIHSHHARVRFGGDYICVTWRSGSASVVPYAYISRDGTPQSAHTWLLNPPRALARAARDRASGPVYETREGN